MAIIRAVNYIRKMTEVRGGVREVSRREQQKNVEALDKNFN